MTSYGLRFADIGEVRPSVSLLKRLRGSSHVGAEGPLFVALDPPASKSKKELRAAIDEAVELQGERRRAALRRIVPVLDVQSYAAIEPCRQLNDDIVYIDQNFGGIGFVVGERGLEVLKACTPPLP